jgi:hypothetical protein
MPRGIKKWTQSAHHRPAPKTAPDIPSFVYRQDGYELSYSGTGFILRDAGGKSKAKFEHV